MDLVALLAIQVLYAIASLALISVGLAIIFGMMRVINLAHGEFLMLGGYAAIEANRLGMNIWISMLVVAPVFVGLVGIAVERTAARGAGKDLRCAGQQRGGGDGPADGPAKASAGNVKGGA